MGLRLRKKPPLGPFSSSVASQIAVSAPSSGVRGAPGAAHTGLHPARAHRVDLDAVWHLVVNNQRQRIQRRLRHTIAARALNVVGERAPARTHVDNPPIVARPHPGNHPAHQMIGTRQHHRKAEVEIFRILQDPGVLQHAGVVDKNVNRADAGKRRFDRGGVADIQCHRLAPNGARCFLAVRHIAHANDHTMIPARHQSCRNRPPNAAIAATYQYGSCHNLSPQFVS